jgi:hypothetical protein
MFSSYFPQPVLRRRPRPARCRARVGARLRLEPLEDRTVPSTVINLGDNGPGSLRDAIAITPAHGTVDFQPGLTGTITLTTGELDIGRDLTIAGPGAGVITVSGNHASRVFGISPSVSAVISGLTVADGFVTTGNSGRGGGGITNFGTLAITNSVVSGNSTDSPDGGGGIYNAGTLTLTNSKVNGNSSLGGGGSFGGGGILNSSKMSITSCTFSGNNTATNGGAIYTMNDLLTITNSTFNGNSSGGEGGGIVNGHSASTTIANSTFSGNSSSSGAGIWNASNAARATITNCTLSGNSASSDGGGLVNQGNLVIGNTIIAGNSAPTGPNVSGTVTSQGHDLIGDGTGGSGFAPTDLVGTAANPIDPRLGPLQANGGPTATMALLPGSPAIYAGDPALSPGPFDQRGPGYPRIVNGTIDIGAFQSHIFAVQNTQDHGTGSLRQAILDANTIPGSTVITFLPGITGTINIDSALPALSSNIDLEGPGALSLTVQPSSGNSFRIFTVGSGAVVTLAGLTIAHGTDVAGGGILNSGGTLTVSNCTIGNNSGGGINNALGTLIVNSCSIANNAGPIGGGLTNSATLTISNSTVAGNTAVGSGSGGGINNTGTLTISSSTIANNSAAGAGGGIFNTGAGTVTVHNTLVAQNQAPTGPDVAGAFISQGHNLIGDGTGGNGFTGTDLVGTSAHPINARLGPLQNNGGATQTLALLAASPAIDAGDSAVAPSLYDQRGIGFPRVANGTMDIGAYEFQVTGLTIIVLNTNDSGPGSLRQAILDANGMAGDKIITFAPVVSGAINLLTTLPDLNSNIDLEGPGPATVTVQRGIPDDLRIFDVTNGATVTIAGLTVAHGQDASNFAGILNQNGSLTVRNCSIDTNFGVGIGSYVGENLTVSNCTFHNNSSGGILVATPAVGSGGVVSVSNCTLTLNTGSGAIASQGGTLNVSNCNIYTNALGVGSSGILNLSSCTIQNNNAGGVNNTGTATIDSSTLSGNSTADGGGIYNTGTLTITNSTVASNKAIGTWTQRIVFVDHSPTMVLVPVTPAVGGGIWNSGTLTVNSCTIAANTAVQTVSPDIGSNGGGIASTGGTVTVHNTIIAQNQSPTGPDVAGTFVSQGYNLIGNGTGGTGFTAAGDQVGTAAAPIDPRLGPLQDNGGPTPTMALLTGSPAIDGGEKAGSPPTDQRGFPRQTGPFIDIGAFETQSHYTTYVVQLYHDLLARAPEPGGLHGWTAALDTGTLTSYQVSSLILISYERLGLEVDGAYVQFLHRFDTPAERAPWVNALRTGAISDSDLGRLFVSSPEYSGLHPGNQDYVIALYNDLLIRNGHYSAAEVAGWKGLLDSGALSRAALAAAFANSAEALDIGIKGMYTTFLRRQPTAAEVQQWWQSVASGQMVDWNVAALFLSSPEYLQHAGHW